MDEEDLKALDKLFDKKLTPIKEDLNEIKETVDANNSTLINLEKEIKVYMDDLDIERKRIDKHDKRLEVIEESLDLNP